MPHDPSIAARDILGEIAFLQGTAARMTFAEFKSDGAACRAVAYSIQIISEAVRHIPDDWLAEHPDQPWAAIRATGNKIRHEYFRIDEAILWEIATTHCVSLKSAMEAIVAKHAAA